KTAGTAFAYIYRHPRGFPAQEVIYVGEHAADALADVGVNAGRLCRDGHGVSFNGADLCAAPQRLPHRDPARRSLDHHDDAAMGRRRGDTAGIREARVYLLLGLGLGSVWRRSDDQRVGPGGSGPSYRLVVRAHTDLAGPVVLRRRISEEPGINKCRIGPISV